MEYFRISLGRDKNKWGKWSLLLISWCAPDKVRYQSLKFDCKCYTTPFSSCLITIWCCKTHGSQGQFAFVFSSNSTKIWYKQFWPRIRVNIQIGLIIKLKYFSIFSSFLVIQRMTRFINLVIRQEFWSSRMTGWPHISHADLDPLERCSTNCKIWN